MCTFVKREGERNLPVGQKYECLQISPKGGSSLLATSEREIPTRISQEKRMPEMGLFIG